MHRERSLRLPWFPDPTIVCSSKPEASNSGVIFHAVTICFQDVAPKAVQ